MLAKGSFFSRLINKYWVSSQYVPLQAVNELQLDISKPIIYVVEQNCANDLLGLQKSCIQAGLPDPYRAITVQGQTISAIIFIDDWYLFSQKKTKEKKSQKSAPYLRQYQQLLSLHQAHEDLDIQLVPVTFYWGRHPGKEGKKSWFNVLEKRQVGALRKSLVVIKNAKDHLIRFNQPISIAALCQREKSAHHLADKLAKVAIRYFGQQKRSSVGPKLPIRSEMINAILQQAYLQKIIAETAAAQQSSEEKVTAQCRAYLEEISANFSYSWLRLFRLILSGLWNHIYHGIEVNHAQNVREASQSGAEIIYMPCHRSHMDYMLLSYILFEQGLVPPHVAAGVNLNFFPAGAIFRRSGAFFLRRSFKGSPLYTQIFKAYFAMLFKQGYPIEFFSEGGRSRTGRLLPPKTGLLAMSLQTYLNQPKRNVFIVPVYIGYDHIMEVNTYTKELSGQKKQSESVWQVLGSIKKLRNFGRVFVNFAEPINIKTYFDNASPNWQTQPLSEQQLKTHVQLVADKVMVSINAAAAVNALPLCAMLLLANQSLRIRRDVLIKQIESHLLLLKLLSKENPQLTYVQGDAQAIYQQALALDKFSQQQGEVYCSTEQARQLSYYRNNIVHLFVINGLLCHCVDYLRDNNQLLTTGNISQYAEKLYPFLQQEYFLSDQQKLSYVILQGLQQLQVIGVLSVKGDDLQIVSEDLLKLFRRHLKETFLRYQQALFHLLESADNWQDVSQEKLLVACKLAVPASAIEAFEKNALQQFLITLKRQYPDFVNEQQGKQLLALFKCAS